MCQEVSTGEIEATEVTVEAVEVTHLAKETVSPSEPAISVESKKSVETQVVQVQEASRSCQT